jgi:iron-sulfur cluster assembly accessory protein
MTESAGAYRPSSLEPGPPPPRGAGVPESSIAGGLPQDRVAALRPWPASSKSQVSSETEPESAPSSDGSAATAVPEKVAQQSQSRNVGSMAKPPAPGVSTLPAAPKKSRLRPRKAAMTLTPTAVEHLRGLLDQPEPKLIRVGVKNKGCSGSSYALEYVDAPAKFDEQVEQDGVKVLIDSRALLKVIGSEMDWVEDKLSARFTFKNPNISKLLLSILSKCLGANSHSS